MKNALLVLALLMTVAAVAAPAEAHPDTPDPCSWSSPHCWTHVLSGDRCVEMPRGEIRCM